MLRIDSFNCSFAKHGSSNTATTSPTFIKTSFVQNAGYGSRTQLGLNRQKMAKSYHLNYLAEKAAEYTQSGHSSVEGDQPSLRKESLGQISKLQQPVFVSIVVT